MRDLIEAAMEADIRQLPWMSEATKKQAREHMAATSIPTWAGFVERQIGDGPFVAGAAIQVADIKLYMVVRWLTSGVIDHVPTTVLDHCPKLLRLFRAVGDHAGVKAWLAKSAA